MSDTRIHALPVTWDRILGPETTLLATERLECGNVLFMQDLAFSVEREEAGLFSPAILSSSKNASYDAASGRVGGTTLEGSDLDRLRQLMGRFSRAAAGLVGRLLPRYAGRIKVARASFRPAEIAGRQTSWRKDDTRLHVDSFPASPVQGERILRVFSNVNPSARARSWRDGEDFDRGAERFAGTVSLPWPAQTTLLDLLHVT